MKKLPIFVLLWLGFTAINLPLIALGWAVVPFMWRLRFKPYKDLPSWTRLWANPEDWTGGPQAFKASLPKWWVLEKGVGFSSFWWYHAIRNPANGMRSVEWLDLDIVPSEVEFVTPKYWRYYAPWELRKTEYKTCMYLCWQGWKAGVQIIHLWSDERHLNLKVGWRVQPSDATIGPDPGGIRSKDAGFATKFLPYRKG